MSSTGINSPSVKENNKPDTSFPPTTTPVFDKYAGQKKRYVPGGPGGGGHYEYPDGTITYVGGTGPGGQHYAGPKGRVGPMNAANGMKPPSINRTPRPTTRRPTVRLVRPPANMATQEELAERRATQRRAAELRKEKETFKPREEQSLYEFHPDLDVNAKMILYDARDFDDVPSDRPVTPNDSSTRNSREQHTPPAPMSNNAEETPLPTPQNDIHGVLASGGRSTRRRQSNISLASAAVKTPSTMRVVPAELQPAKERLEMHPPIWKKVDTFAAFRKDEVKINDAMARVGYQVDNVYTRPEQFHRQTEVVPDADQDKVEYDMDLFDRYWLDILNKQRRPKYEEISPEIFEITITKIEKEYAALERRVPKPNPRPPQTQRPRSSSAAAVNGEPGEEPDTTCVICDDGDCENTNAIVFCDGCNIPVHQDCYGIPNIPEGQWLCRKCVAVGGGVPTCIFCPNSEGAFKQTNDQRWGHVLCAMWIPEVSFPNTMFMEPIQDINRIPKGRKALLCYICNQQMGAPIQCGKSNCYRAFHVSCAKRVRLPLKMKNSQGVLAVNDPTMILKAFCDKHCPADYAKDHNVSENLRSVQEYYKEAMQARVWADSHDIAAAILREYTGADDIHDLGINGSRAGSLLQNGEEEEQNELKNVWKLPSGAPVVPFYVLSRVEEYMSQFVKQGLREWVASATKYWTCKIEIRRGARLIRHYQTQNDGASMDTTRRDFNGMGIVGRDRLERRIDFVDGLSNELHKIADCSNEDYDHIVAGTEAAREKIAEVDALLFPINHLVDNIVGSIQASSDGDFILPYLSGITEKLQTFSYTHAEDFLDDLAQACNQSIKGLSETSDIGAREIQRYRSMIDRLWTNSVGTELLDLITKESRLYEKDLLQLKNILQSAQVTAHTVLEYAVDADQLVNVEMVDVEPVEHEVEMEHDDEADAHVDALVRNTDEQAISTSTDDLETKESNQDAEESAPVSMDTDEQQGSESRPVDDMEDDELMTAPAEVSRGKDEPSMPAEPGSEAESEADPTLPTQETDLPDPQSQAYDDPSSRSMPIGSRLTPPASSNTASSSLIPESASTTIPSTATIPNSAQTHPSQLNTSQPTPNNNTPYHPQSPLQNPTTPHDAPSEDDLSDLDDSAFLDQDVEMHSPSPPPPVALEINPSSPLSAAHSVGDEGEFLAGQGLRRERRSMRRK